MTLKKLRNGKYQVRWRDDERKQRARNFRSKERAQDFLREIRAGLERAEARAKATLTFEEFARVWERDYLKVEKSPTQQVTEPQTIRKYLVPAFGTKHLADLTKMDLLNLRGQLKSEGRLKVKSVNVITSLAKSMLEKASEWDMVRANPFRAVKLLRAEQQPFAYWTVDERDRFLTFCRGVDPAFADLVEFACMTGLRYGELLGLKRDCLDFGRRMVTVRRSFNKTVGQVFETTKGHRYREVWLNSAAYRIAMASRLREPAAFVFGATPLTHASRQLKRVAKLAGVREIRFHDLRHTFASHLAMAGRPLQEIQVLLGHTDIKLTMRYAHLHPASLRGATDTLVSAPNVHAQEGFETSNRNYGGIPWGHTDSNSDRHFAAVQ